MMGGDGLTQATSVAVLSANYIAARLREHYPVLYSGENGLVAHECILDLRDLTAESGVTVDDVAKRLIDYGFHAYTVSFPTIVKGAMMIEPTETEGKHELDLFIEAMISIAKEVEDDPQMVLHAPYNTRTTRVDEVGAARRPILRWKPERTNSKAAD
jgi:glycine cleavage system protein P-like pyridoxal-binding family